jgi:hypothetical protein
MRGSKQLRVRSRRIPLPGSVPSTPTGMGNYIVVLKRQHRNAAPTGRGEIYAGNLRQTAAFQEKLSRWLDEHGLATEVAGMAEPVGFPLISLTSTPAIAKAIESFPEVESVVADSGMISLAAR